MTRPPQNVPAPVVAAVLAWCARAGRPAIESEVRDALAPLSPAEEKQLLRIAAATPPSGQAFGLRSLVAMAQDAAAAHPPLQDPAPRPPPRPRRRLPLPGPAEVPVAPAERHRAVREGRQRQILDLYAKRRDAGRVAADLGLTPAELEALVEKLALRRRVRALMRGELVEYPPLRPRGVPARPVGPIRRKPAPRALETPPPTRTPGQERVLVAERRTLLALFDRLRGERGRTARELGISLEALEQRFVELGLGADVKRMLQAVRRRELDRESLPDRIRQVLQSATYLEDLGILWKVDRDLKARIEGLWNKICSESPSERAAAAALKLDLALSETHVRRLLQRYALTFPEK